MKPLRKFLVLLFVLAVPSLVLAADEKAMTVERIISAGRDNNRVMEHLDWLCNRLGPRLTSSDSLQNASEWSRDTFAGFGLNARLEEWGEFPVGFNRGPWFGSMIKPQEKALHFGTPAWSAGTKGVVRGPVVLSPTTDDELAAVQAKLAGAWVFMRRSAEARPSRELQTKFNDLLKDAKVAGIVRSSAGDLIHTFGNHNISWDKLPTTPNITLLRKEFDEIVELASKGEEVVLEFDIRNYFKKGPIKLYNVVADLPGTEWPDEYVIVGGHIDAWDGATGTGDNGVGCAAVIEAARILTAAGVKPRRTIRFMLWSGEEQGLLGSSGYIRKNRDLMKKISAVLVHDGGTNYTAGIQATEAMTSDMEQVFGPVKNLNPDMPFEIHKVEGLPAGIGSDHDAFLSAGVPGFYWVQKGRANYQRIHHTHFDTFDYAIPEYQQHSSIVIALAAHGIADLDHLLSREKLVGARRPFAAGRRFMGVQLDELTISDVIADTPAARAGFKAGDVIAKVDGKKVANRDELIAEIQKGEPKKTITLVREGKEIEAVLTWPSPAGAGAPAADEQSQSLAVVEKAITAAGGREKLAKHNAVTWRETGTYYGMGDGLPYAGNYAVQWPHQFRMEIEGVFTIVLDGDKGWLRSNNETRDMTEQELAQQREQHYVGWVASLVPLKEKQFRLSKIDEIKVDDRPAIGVKVSSDGHGDVKLYFDKESGLLVKSVSRGQSPEQGFKEVEQEMLFRNYQDVDGAKIPMKLVMNRDSKVFVEAEMHEMKADGKLDASVFAKP